MRDFEFVIYDEGANPVDHQFIMFDEKAQAKAKAGRLSKQYGGPVDLAFAEPGKKWEDRYITTASPSEYHSSGFRFERLV